MTVKVEEKMILLSMENIQKKFFGKYANKNVHLQVEKGKILALLGENGAGKTTLMNILYGLYQPDGGKIFWHGEEVKFESPKDAIERKIGMVHQHFMLVPTLNVSQNITLGLKETGYPLTDRKAVNRKIKSLSDQYGLIVDPEAMVSDLSVGEQQRVEIMKLLYRDAELLILDEPTAVLTRQETIGLFEVLKRLSQDGRSVILITHKIPEVMEIADMVTVMRDAESIITVPITEVDEASL
ncbi:MAG TPA: ATP-binding cassette domain-containing protein, partial [Flexilinea sp.]|nr:ATP-binding cassette domain-containing protein [Flexilinea sp.]